jgi:PHD finger protein 12
MNYSEYGTTVDNVLYSCDFSDKKIHTITDNSNDSATVASVKQILKKARKRRLESNEENRKSEITLKVLIKITFI